jgi:hypothetical protein
MSNRRTPVTPHDAFLAGLDRIDMGKRDRDRAKAQYLQIEAVVDRIWNLGARMARGVTPHGTR